MSLRPMSKALLAGSLLVVMLAALLPAAQAHSEYRPYLMRKIREAERRRGGRFLHAFGVADENEYFRNVFKVSQGGTNAEAYWSYDNTRLTFQAQLAPYNVTHPCDLIWNVDITGQHSHLVSPAAGRDTCSYFCPNGTTLIYSSTMAGGRWCPAPPDQDFGYVWPLNKDMDIYTHDLQSGKYRPLLPNFPPGYTAESTISPDGKRIVFTSDFEGDLELYTMDLDGSNIERMTYTPGYDGGAYFSFDNNMLVWRANRPQGADLTRYLQLLDLGMVEPVNMQIYITLLSGPMAKVPIKVTNNSGVSFAPFFLPNNKGIIFSSNMHDPMGGDFQLYVINIDGSGLKQITTKGSFNAFPMFSFDGKKIAWCSNRDAGPQDYATIDIYVADWVGDHLGQGSVSRLLIDL